MLSGANSTIKERYYGAASTTPTTVFGRLLSLSRHHLAKFDTGKSVYYEKLLQSVITDLIVTGYLNIYRWSTSRVSQSVITIKEDLYKTTTDKEKLILYKYGNSNKQSLRLHLFI